MAPHWIALNIKFYDNYKIRYLCEEHGIKIFGQIMALILDLAMRENEIDLTKEFTLQALAFKLGFKKNVKKLKEFLEIIILIDDFYLDGNILKSKMVAESFKNYHKRNFKFNTTERYNAYLNSEHWQTLSNNLKKEVGSCEMCGEIKSLEVHHKSYANLKQEKRQDLIVVCRKCHQKFHDKEEE